MRFRIIAVAAALLCTAFLIGLFTWLSATVLPWLDGLSARETSILRTWIIVMGALLPVFGAVLRRGKVQANDAPDD